MPLAVIGTRQVMPKGRLRTEPADVTLIVHDPIQPPALDAPTPRDAKALADRVHAIVAAAVEERQFGATESSKQCGPSGSPFRQACRAPRSIRRTV